VALAIGIDLGTTNSVVACYRDGKIEVVCDDEGNRLHPSVIGFVPNGEVVIGHAAVERRHLDPRNTIYSAKRLIGQSIRNPMVQMALSGVPYEVVEGDNEQPMIVVRGARYSVPDISAMVLRYLKRLAEVQFGQSVTKAVITVPANFTDSQRQATKAAGEIAGLEVLRILNEPTAAALAYGFGRELDGQLAVFDLGGGTFDATALQVSDSIFEVLATGGDPFLGGDDFDRTLVEDLAQELNRQFQFDAFQDPNALAKLRSAAEQIKIRLSEDDVCAGTIHELATAWDGREIDLDFEVTRGEFERRIEPYVSQAVRKCREVLRAARVDPAELADLILVGGSTRTPLVREAVEYEFERVPQTRVNPDETVAFGAALQAAQLAGAETSAGRVQALLLDVCPRALGIKVAGGYNEIIIEQNTPIPVERQRSFTTSKNDQTTVNLEICQGESRQFTDNELLGVLRLDDIPPRPRGESKIEVTFTIDADGILSVRARDLLTDKQTQATMHVVGAPTSRASSLPPPAASQASSEGELDLADDDLLTM